MNHSALTVRIVIRPLANVQLAVRQRQLTVAADGRLRHVGVCGGTVDVTNVLGCCMLLMNEFNGIRAAGH